MSCYFRVFTVCLSLLIVACGGSSKEEIITTPPNTNAPTAVVDTATTLNNAAVTIAVLANDSDAEGDALSLTAILTNPIWGTAAISGNSVVYTPNVNQIGSDSLTYEVSDGDKVSSATVTIENTQTITFSGAATDSPLVNAAVTFTINGNEVQTTTDDRGKYSVEAPLTSLNGNIIVKAQGESGTTQSQATLFSFAGSVADALAQSGENRLLDETVMPSLNINQLSSAKYLLALAENQSTNSVDSTEFSQLIDISKSTDLLELAAFIKLIIDNDNYSLSGNQTIENFFFSAENQNPNLQIRDFLSQNGLINISGDYSEMYATDLEMAISETAEEFKLMFDDQAFLSLGDKFISYVGDLKDGFLPRKADIFEFTTSSTGIHWKAVELESQKYEFDWRVEDGKLHITYNTDNLIGTESFPQYSSFEVYRFGEDAIAKAAEISEGFGFPAGQLRILSQPKSDILTLVASDGDELQVSRQRTEQEVLFLRDENETHQFTFDQGSLHSNSIVSISSNDMLSENLLIGQWLTHLFYEYIPDIPTEEEYRFIDDNSRLNADILTLNEDHTATTKFAQNSFLWSLSDNRTLSLTDNDHKIDITPFIESSDGFAALFVVTINGAVTKEYVREFYKLDAQIDASNTALITDQTEAYVSLLSATDSRVWESGMLGIDYLLGYQFYEGNVADRVGVFYEDLEFKTNPYFAIGASWNKRVVTQEETTLTFKYDQNSIIRQRNWQIIKRNEAGRIWVLESFFFSGDENDNGILDRFSLIIPPRLNSLIKVDLSKYEGVWANTDQNEIGQP